MDLLILQVAFRLETFPAVLALVAFGRKSPRTGWLGGMETPSGSRLVFSFLGHFSKIFLPCSSLVEYEGGELSELVIEKSLCDQPSVIETQLANCVQEVLSVQRIACCS